MFTYILLTELGFITIQTYMKKLSFFISLLLLAIFQVGGDIYAAKSESIRLGDDAARPELVLQTGHSKLVKAVVFGPDNRWVASGSFDNTIKIWDLETGRELRSLSGHTGAVNALVCSPDGKWLASGGNDNSVRIWEIESGKEIRNFSGRNGTIETLAFSPDGKRLAAGGSAGSVVLLDLESGRELAALSGHTASVTTLIFSPDGKLMASGGSDQTVKIWDIAKSKELRSLKGHTDAITVLRFSDDGSVLASGSADNTVRIWQMASGRNLAVLNGHASKILALNFLHDGKLMSADVSGAVKTWDTAAKSEVLPARLLVETVEAESAIFSRDGSLLAFGNGDGTAAVADAKTGQRLNLLENHTSGFYGIAFSPDRRWLAAASFDNTVKLWDLQTGQSVSPLKGHTGRVTCVAFHPDSRRIISGSLDNTIRIWDTVTLKTLATLKGHKDKISSLAVGSKGKIVVSGSSDKTIGIWDLETKAAPRFLNGHSGEVISVAISNDERFVASASFDATIKIWDIATGTALRTIEPKSGEVDAVAFSPDGKFIASGGADKMVSIWETETGNLVRTMPGHSGAIYAISYSGDGRQIVSSSQDKTVRVWNAQDGRESGNMTGHVGKVFSATFLPDQRLLASASEDGSIIIWNKENGSRLSTLISLKNSDDWLVVTPEGFFDGSQSSWRQLSWRFEKSTFNVKPVEVFFSEFWLPGLLSELLNDKKLPANANISNKDRRQPVLKLSSASTAATGRDLRVRIDISNAPAGAKDVRLFRNGALVKVWRGDVLKGARTTFLEANVPIVAGDNRFMAYAYNTDDIKSRDAAITVTGPPGLGRKGVSYILAIGVNEYANTEYNLSQAVNDADDFAGELKKQQTKLGAAERVEVVALSDKNATKANILKAIAELAAKIQPEDWLTVFFAGHGIAKQNRFYLIPHDLGYAGSRGESSAATVQTIIDHSISDEELDRAVEGIDAGQILLVIDACNSGQALEADEKRRGPMNSKGLAQLAYEKGMYILTAAQSYQNAIENERLGHGYLTYALIEEGLKTNVADREPKDGQILLREWLDYATTRVPQIDQEELEKVGNKARQLEREKSKAAGQGADRAPQRPRVFYRREAEANPFVVARP